MPQRARQAHFDDYFAPPEVADGFELHRLVNELDHRKRKLGPDKRAKIELVKKAVIEGEFDGTAEESARWAASKEGQETFRQLLGE